MRSGRLPEVPTRREISQVLQSILTSSDVPPDIALLAYSATLEGLRPYAAQPPRLN